MKPFGLEKAIDGHPVITRDGHPARIICFDRRGKAPIVALVGNCENEEKLFSYDILGEIWGCPISSYDLFLAPVKKEGWINLYKSAIPDANIHGSAVYLSESEALAKASPHCVGTAKIEWEE